MQPTAQAVGQNCLGPQPRRGERNDCGCRLRMDNRVPRPYFYRGGKWRERPGPLAELPRPIQVDLRALGLKQGVGSRGKGEASPNYCDIALPTCENTVFALVPIKRTVPITITRITANI